MIKVSLIVLCGLLAAAMLRRQSAAMRHWILAAAIACAAAAPALEQFVPAWQVEGAIAPAAAPAREVGAPASGSAQAAAAPARERSREGRRFDPLPVVGLLVPIWIAGAGFGVLVLCAGMSRLWWIRSRARALRDGRWFEAAREIAARYGVRRRIVLLQSGHPTLLVTWGVLRPKILLPAGAEDWPDERIRVVLAHEVAHIRRGDWAAQLTAEMLRAIYWFNPLLWLASTRLRQESEQACDDAVLNLGVEARAYAAHLLDLARAAAARRGTEFPPYPAPAMVRPSSLERRVTAMLNTRLNRTPTTRRARIAATLAVLAFAVLVAGFGAAAQRFATFSGSIFDPQNGAVPKVTVVLTHTQTQAKYEVKSDVSGRFEFAALPAGDYLLEAKYPGFMTLNGTVTVAGQDVHRNFALQIGQLQETIRVSGTAATAAAPEPVRAPRRAVRRQEACTPAEAGGNIRPPRKILDVRPIYPQHLQEASVAGVVQLQARIGPDGDIADVQVADTSHPDLATAAMDAVRQWQFTPTLLNCVPVAVSMTVTITFELEK